MDSGLSTIRNLLYIVAGSGAVISSHESLRRHAVAQNSEELARFGPALTETV